MDEVVKLHSCSAEDKAVYEKKGLEAIQKGKCAFLLLAGGQVCAHMWIWVCAHMWLWV